MARVLLGAVVAMQPGTYARYVADEVARVGRYEAEGLDRDLWGEAPVEAPNGKRVAS